MKEHWKKPFALICAGQAFSLLGSAAVQFAIIWWLTVQTESAITLTLATMAGFLPTMVLGPFAGVWIDRYNRRTVMMAADGLVAVSSALLFAAFLLLESPPVWFIYAMLVLRGLGNTFHSPAMQAAIPMLVPGELLIKAGGWGNLINSLSAMLGPVLGAALMGLFPLAPIMLVDIAGAVFAIGCLLFVKIPDIPQSGGKVHFLADMKAGIAAIRGNKPLMAAFIPVLLSTVAYMPLGALFPLLVKTHFNGTAWHNSVVEFVFAGGLLVSSFVMGIWGGLKRRFLMIAAAIAMLGASIAVASAMPPTELGFAVFAALCFFMGSSGTFLNVPFMAYIQSSTAPDQMGKVLSFLVSAMTWAMPVGLVIAGPVSESIGVANWFVYSGIALVATGILCYLTTRKYDAPIASPPDDPKPDEPAPEV